MALGPKEMGEAIIRNLKQKTGKTLEEWLEILSQAQHTDKKSVMTFLKTEHNLGHFQAQKIFEQYSGTDKYTNPDLFIDQLFKTKSSLKMYKHISDAILSFGKDVEVKPCQTYIPFYRKTQFALVTMDKHDNMVLALNLPEGFQHDKFKMTKSLASTRINFETIIEGPNDMDDEMINIVRQAYHAN